MSVTPNATSLAESSRSLRSRAARDFARSLPRGSSGDVVNGSPAAQALKARLLARVGRNIGGLGFGEPVRFAEVMWSLMNEPGVTDVQGLQLVPSPLPPGAVAPKPGENVAVKPTQIAVFVDNDAGLTIV